MSDDIQWFRALDIKGMPKTRRIVQNSVEVEKKVESES